MVIVGAPDVLVFLLPEPGSGKADERQDGHDDDDEADDIDDGIHGTMPSWLTLIHQPQARRFVPICIKYVQIGASKKAGIAPRLSQHSGRA
jgi:hypothetical protein